MRNRLCQWYGAVVFRVQQRFCQFQDTYVSQSREKHTTNRLKWCWSILIPKFWNLAIVLASKCFITAGCWQCGEYIAIVWISVFQRTYVLYWWRNFFNLIVSLLKFSIKPVFHWFLISIKIWIFFPCVFEIFNYYQSIN